MKVNRLLSALAGEGDSGGGGGAPPTTWHAQLPEDLRANASISKFKSVAELAKGYVNAESLIGTKRIPEPQATWKEEDWNALYSSLGRPTNPDGYKLPDDFKLPEGLTLDAEKMKKANVALHSAGLTPAQYNKVMAYYAGTLGEAQAAAQASQQRAVAQGTAALKQEWGENYGPNLDIAKSVVAKFGGDDLMASLEKSGAANDPLFIKSLHRIGVAMLDDKAIGSGSGGLRIMDVTAAKREISDLTTDKDFMEALNTANHPGHKVAVDRWLELHKTAAKAVQE